MNYDIIKTIYDFDTRFRTGGQSINSFSPYVEYLKFLKEKSDCDAAVIYIRNGEYLQIKSFYNKSLYLQPQQIEKDIQELTEIALFDQSGSENHKKLCASVVHNKAMINIKNIDRQELFDTSDICLFSQDDSYRVRSILAYPLKDHSDDVVGVIQLINSKDDFFSENDETYMSFLCKLFLEILTLKN